jgi:hypothetical protein
MQHSIDQTILRGVTMWDLIDERTVDGFDILTSVQGDDCDPKHSFDDPEIVQAIYDDEFEWFVVRVEARKAGVVLGATYLGGCCYKEHKDFVEAEDYHADMVREAIDEAKKTITKINEA